MARGRLARLLEWASRAAMGGNGWETRELEMGGCLACCIHGLERPPLRPDWTVASRYLGPQARIHVASFLFL